MPVPAATTVIPLIIGTYTTPLAHADGKAEGILGAEFDTATGTFGPVRLLAKTRNPSYLVLSRSGQHLYAADETADPDARNGGAVTAFAIDPRSGELTDLGTQPSGGAAACHLTVDRTGRFVLVANYHSGCVSVFPIEADGSLGTATDHVQHHGSSVHPDRQTSAHAHMVAVDPRTGDVLVPDLGMDAVMVYRLEPDGTLTERPEARIPAEPGAGPRHLAFHPDGERLYVLGELDSTVLALRRAGTGYRREAIVSTLPAGFTGHNQAGAIRVSPSGRHVLVSNRGHDSIGLLRVDDGGPTLVSTEPTRGNWPRDLVLDADGRHVFVANQNSDVISAYALDEDAPALRPLGTLSAPTPVCVLPV